MTIKISTRSAKDGDLVELMMNKSPGKNFDKTKFMTEEEQINEAMENSLKQKQNTTSKTEEEQFNKAVENSLKCNTTNKLPEWNDAPANISNVINYGDYTVDNSGMPNPDMSLTKDTNPISKGMVPITRPLDWYQ